jgi:hypothetical protein
MLDRDSRNKVSSSCVGGMRQLAAWGWGRLSRRGAEQGARKKSSAVQHAGTPAGLDEGVGRGLWRHSGPNINQVT